MARELLPQVAPEQWDSQKPGANTGYKRVLWLQNLNDLIKRPVANRLSGQSAGTAVNCNGAAQSTGIGCGPLQPKRYAEFTVKARVSFNVNSAGPAYVRVYRTLGAIPANGAAPNAGDVEVGGDSFMGGATVNGVTESGNLSYLDSGLDVTKQYSYYLAVVGPNGNVLNLVSGSQVLVMERS